MILPSIVRHLVVSLIDMKYSSERANMSAHGTCSESGNVDLPQQQQRRSEFQLSKLTAPDQMSGDSSGISGASGIVPPFGNTS